MPVSKNDTDTRAMGKIAKLKPKYDLDRETVVDRNKDARRAFARRNEMKASFSVDAELLLQARRRRSVLEHQTLIGIDVAMRLLRHQRAFMVRTLGHPDDGHVMRC